MAPWDRARLGFLVLWFGVVCGVVGVLVLVLDGGWGVLGIDWRESFRQSTSHFTHPAPS